MRFIMLLVIGMLGSLTACSDSNLKDKLEGERITINYKHSSLMANPAALETGLRLPRYKNNNNWEQTGGNAMHSLVHLKLEDKLNRKWKKSLGGGNSTSKKLLNSPVYENGVLFASNNDGEIYAISIDSGKTLWETEKEPDNDENLDYAPGLAVKNNYLFVALSSGEVFALDAKTGKEKWKVSLGLPLRSAPSVDNNYVYIIANNNSFYALDVKTGALKWTHNGIEEQLAILGGPSAAISEKGLVLVPYSSGEIYALSKKDGRYIWHDALSINVGSDLYSSLVDVEASPVIADDVVYAVNHNGQLSAFDIKNGRRYWSISLSATQMPWVAGSVIYIVTENGEIVCINRRDGLIRWVKKLNSYLSEKNNDKNIYWAGPLLAGDKLVVTSSLGDILFLDPYKGELKDSFNVDEPLTITPIIADGNLVLFTDEARLITFK